MIETQADFDFTRIRKYHPEIELIASSRESNGETITSLQQTIYIDLIPGFSYEQFFYNYERLLTDNGLQDEHALEILYLMQITYSDIEIANQNQADLIEAVVNLDFLLDLATLLESNTNAHIKSQSGKPSRYDNLTINIQSTKRNGSATLNNPIVTDYVIKKIMEVFKSKSYNAQLSEIMRDVELNTTNIKNIKKQINYRSTDVERFCIAQTVSRIQQYLNEFTSFSSPRNGLLNKQARFIFDLLSLFNLLRHIVDLKQLPRTALNLNNYKTSVIKTLLKNHYSLLK